MRRRRGGRAIAAAFLSCAAWCMSAAGEARAGGDLTPEAYSPTLVRGNVPPGDFVEGCAGGETNRLLLRYAMRTRNIGDQDIVLGNPGCPDCRANPGAACTNPYFICSTAHGHAHFEGFAVADLFTAEGEHVVQGRKYGFCLLDTECPVRVYNCQNQGVSAGCADTYGVNTSCQYIDLTDLDLAVGDYLLRVEVDPENAIAEDDDDNNTHELPISLTCANAPSPLRCDDGDPCTVGERCADGECAPPAITPRSIRVKMRKGSSESGDRLVLTARFDSTWLAQEPTESGVELTLSQPGGGVVYSAFLPPAGFEAIGDGEYIFRDVEGVHEEANGITRMRMHVASGRRRVIVRAIGSGMSLPPDAFGASMQLTQVYGSGPTTVCLAQQDLECAGSSTARSCSDR